MKRIRIGKDIQITWSIRTNGEDATLEGRNLTLFLVDPSGGRKIQNFSVQGNVIKTVLRGVVQKYIGKYGFTLFENYYKNGQTAVDACNAFELVKTTCMEGGADEGLDTEVVELEGDMYVGVKGDDGKSAYQVAVDNGFQGTEEEWLASLKGEPFTYSDFTPEQIADLKRPATEAAAAANQAAENAQQAAQQANDSAASANAAATKAESAANLATQATEQVNDAISGVEAAGQSATAAALIAEQKANLANSAAQQASKSAEAASQAALKAEEATEQAESATASANSAAESANTAAENANQIAEGIDSRVKAVEDKASQVYESFDAIQSSGETNPNKIYIDGSDMQPYVYKDGKFVKFKGTEFDTLGYRYYSIDKNGANIKNIHAEHIAYDEETGSIYLAYIHPTNLLVKIDDFKVTIYANYSMVYDRSDSPMVIIGEKLYALFNNSASSSFIRRIDKYTLQEELSMSYDGIIDGNAGCGLYKINDELYLRGKDNKLYNVNKDDLTLSETGIENIQCICNFRLDTIAYTDGANAYLYNGEITNTKQLPEGYKDLYFINTYRAKNNDNTLLLVLCINSKIRMFSFGSETSGDFTTNLGNKKVYPFVRIRNLYETDSPCLLFDSTMIYCASHFPSFSYGTKEMIPNSFNCSNAYLYGNKDIYVSNDGLVM